MPGPDHERLARWAADCAERCLCHFEAVRPDDPRPRLAVRAARDWANGQLRVTEARRMAFAAHAAAREVEGAARSAARASGHAAATAHVATHAQHAANYSLKSVMAVAGPEAIAEEREWQQEHRPRVSFDTHEG